MGNGERGCSDREGRAGDFIAPNCRCSGGGSWGVSLYIDSSALLKRYVREKESAHCERLLRADPVWVTARHTWVEVQRNLARLLEGADRTRLLKVFAADWKRMNVVEIDRETCERAGDLARTQPGVRTLDALHLAAAQRVGGTTMAFVTYDIRQARAARELGIEVLGA
ncbi:MAG: PIN domain-containing protein [Myxococcales bacterium]|nr:MAG: PIN domain-containing protein [Myxococcales bacterium]